jgi:hypothetical protein
VTPANRPEGEATPELKEDLRRLGLEVDALFIDRAYVNSELAEEVKGAGGEVVCKPWHGRNARPGMYALAHLGQHQGPRARYRGTRKNTFDLRRLCAIQNLESIHRRIDEQRLAA